MFLSGIKIYQNNEKTKVTGASYKSVKLPFDNASQAQQSTQGERMWNWNHCLLPFVVSLSNRPHYFCTSPTGFRLKPCRNDVLMVMVS